MNFLLYGPWIWGGSWVGATSPRYKAWDGTVPPLGPHASRTAEHFEIFAMNDFGLARLIAVSFKHPERIQIGRVQVIE